MRKVALSIFLSISLLHPCRAADYGALDSLLTLFYTNLQPAGIDEKCAELDGLISTCRDSLTRQHVALEIFEHYKEPPVMGEEEVAVRLYDKWIATGLVTVPGEFAPLEAKMFADFNRSTLLGAEAPVIELFSQNGKSVRLPSSGRTSIIFFYDTACGKCKLEAKVLPGILKSVNFHTDFFAVYCGSEKKSWTKFRREFKIKNSHIKTHHIWDPEIKSNYIKLYGVISTPRLYLITPDGLVAGRRLEADSLQQLLPLAKTIADTYEKTQKHDD